MFSKYLICISKESKLNPKRLTKIVSGMIVSSIINGGCGLGKRSCFKEVNNDNI